MCQSFDAGSYFLNLDQPASRLVQTLLEEQVDLPADFLRQEAERSEKETGEPDLRRHGVVVAFDVRQDQ